MTDERTMDERYDNDGDARVTRAYRELGDVSSPAHLDDAILRRARQESRPRYARLRLWTRPVAWAATIGLSLVIVLQLNEGALQPEPDAAPTSASPAEGAKKSAESLSDDVPAPGRAPETVEQERDEAALPSTAQSLVPEDVDLMKEAADMARMRVGEQQRPAEASAAGVEVLTELVDEDIGQHCDDESRATPETWLECIAALDEQGLTTEALFERAAFEKQFPGR